MMNCMQCEQTLDDGCAPAGVCGKDPNLDSLQETMILGAKGVSAYATHAREMGYVDEGVDGAVHETLYTTLTNVNFDLEETLDQALDLGAAAIDAMELLDEAHTETLGRPEPTEVPENDVEGKSIVVTGHDLYALKELLEQSEGEGVNVYTHSEMLPAHGYPELAKYDHLKGNVGGAWFDQQQLFREFPGAIVGTSNCLMPPSTTYEDRFYTTTVAGLDGATHLDDGDFAPVVERAKELPASDDGEWNGDGTLSTGFYHETVLDMAPQIVEAVEEGKLRHFFVIAGCDAPTDGREYYRELAKQVPEDCVVLTTGCGKFRFNDLEYGTVPGTEIPRFIDLGQCNDSISTVKIATALADAFDCGVNDLPVSIVLSWFEQKAVAVLLGLFHLGIEDVRIGPSLPEWLTPDLVEVLNEEWGLQPIGDPRQDLADMLGEPPEPAAAD
ncbi:MAG: hydroxylamine reductase [Haloarculaceae archaeon]